MGINKSGPTIVEFTLDDIENEEPEVSIYIPVNRAVDSGENYSWVDLRFSWLSFFMLIVLYLIIALGADNFQGYYLKKYLEEYRQLSGYSIEEWYGKKSKMYKESLKK